MNLCETHRASSSLCSRAGRSIFSFLAPLTSSRSTSLACRVATSRSSSTLAARVKQDEHKPFKLLECVLAHTWWCRETGRLSHPLRLQAGRPPVTCDLYRATMPVRLVSIYPRSASYSQDSTTAVPCSARVDMMTTLSLRKGSALALELRRMDSPPGSKRIGNDTCFHYPNTRGCVQKPSDDFGLHASSSKVITCFLDTPTQATSRSGSTLAEACSTQKHARGGQWKVITTHQLCLHY